MDSEDRMDFSERRKYLRIMRKRYKEASRKERSSLLDEMEAVTGLHRKSLIRLLGSPIQRMPSPTSLPASRSPSRNSTPTTAANLSTGTSSAS